MWLFRSTDLFYLVFPSPSVLLSVAGFMLVIGMSVFQPGGRSRQQKGVHLPSAPGQEVESITSHVISLLRIQSHGHLLCPVGCEMKSELQWAQLQRKKGRIDFGGQWSPMHNGSSRNRYYAFPIKGAIWLSFCGVPFASDIPSNYTLSVSSYIFPWIFLVARSLTYYHSR